MNPPTGAGTEDVDLASSWPYFDELHCFLQGRHSINPPLIIESENPVRSDETVNNAEVVGRSRSSTPDLPDITSTLVPGPSQRSSLTTSLQRTSTPVPGPSQRTATPVPGPSQRRVEGNSSNRTRSVRKRTQAEKDADAAKLQKNMKRACKAIVALVKSFNITIETSSEDE